MPIFDTRPVAIIGAGPSGLAAARNLDRQGVAWVGFDLAGDVGGLWNIDSPRSTVYASAHLISSARTTEFAEFPMPADTPDYPDHRRLLAYFATSPTTSAYANGSASAPRWSARNR